MFFLRLKNNKIAENKSDHHKILKHIFFHSVIKKMTFIFLSSKNFIFISGLFSFSSTNILNIVTPLINI